VECHSSLDSIDCRSSNIIYLITCTKCNLQYVGETAQKLNARFNLHRSGIRNKDKINFCKRLCSHFHEGLCKDAEFTVNVIEKLEGNGRLPNGKVDLDIASLRRRKEKEWMLKLRTVYPYGLNDRVSAKTFPPLKRNKPHPLRIRTSSFHPNNSVNSFLNIFSTKLNNDIKSCMNFSRSIISSLKKSKLKALLTKINDHLVKQIEGFYILNGT